jgi:hypothetical protein
MKKRGVDCDERGESECRYPPLQRGGDSHYYCCPFARAESLDYLKDLARSLYERRHDAAVVPYEDRSDDQFQPTRNECHRNVDVWSQRHPSHRAVRGWLVFDYSNEGRYRFMPHSLVEDETGRRFDLTAYTRHPFLEFEGVEEEFVLLISTRQLTHIDHYF